MNRYDREMLALAVPALGINASIFSFAFVVFNFLAYGTTPLTPLYVSLGVNAINLVLDPLLIFGFGWGLAGAAWATAIAQWAGAAGFLWLIFAGRREELGVEPVRPRIRELVPLMKVGGSLATRTLSLIGTMTLATAIAARVGTAAVAAHQVGSQVWLFLALVVDSVAIAAQAMVARYRGAGESGAAREAADRLLLWGVALGAAVVLLLVVPMGWGLAGVWWGIVALMGMRAATLALAYLRPAALGRASAG